MKERWLKYGPTISIVILLVLYTVGIGGMFSQHRAWFLSLTPMTLLVSTILLLLTHKDWRWAFFLVSVICLTTGFGIEVAGVETGMIFGEYAYGETLGWKWIDVPLIIGCNWFILVYTSGVVVSRIRTSRPVRALIAASTMTLLDLLIEPVAIAFDFWHWKDGTPPLQNYLAWFAVAFSLSMLFQSINFLRRNAVAPVLLILQFVFFGILNLLILWE